MDWPALTQESLRIWNGIAGFWDAHMGESGNQFHRQLVCPTADRLLRPGPGMAVLELGCGTGLYARHLSAAGTEVVATDGCQAFLDIASERCRGTDVTFQELDATQDSHWHSLMAGRRRFDAAVANMMLMDIASITPLFRNVWNALRPGGCWVFTLLHPCFNSGNVTLLSEQGESRTLHSVRVLRYMDVDPYKGEAVRGQPEPHIYFHRPLHVIFNALFAIGFAVDGLEEAAFPESGADERHLSWGTMPQIPPVLGIRARKPDNAREGQ